MAGMRFDHCRAVVSTAHERLGQSFGIELERSEKAIGRRKSTHEQASVILAQAGIQRHWVPACAGTTVDFFLPLA
jgi:hypothetical protein